MEQTNEQVNRRYVEIGSCTKCGHGGHITSASRGGIIYICGNPDHSNLDVPKELIGKTAYPIVLKEQDDTVRFVPIPSWCTLPKEVVVPK